VRTASYSRVSTEEQVEGLSLSAQQRGVREYCAAKGWDTPDQFVDEGRSARSETIDKRPALKSLLQACEDRRYDVVVVYSLDRWSRNLKVTLQTFGTLAGAQVAFASVTESVDYSTPEGRLFVAMLGAFAQYFSDSLAKHTSKGIAERVHQGRPAGPLPFGYERGEKGIPVPIPSKAEAVRQAFKMRASGSLHSEIAACLNTQGFRTTAGHVFTNFAVRDILKNPFYVGQLRYRGTIYPGNHEAIVDINLYSAAQAARRTRTSRGGVKDYLLRRLARCSSCGSLLWSCTNSRGSDYYRHWSGRGDCSVGNKMAPCAAVDEQLSGLFASLKLEQGWRETVVSRVIALSERDRIARERKLAEERLVRLGRAYVDDMIPERTYEGEQRRLKDRLASLQLPEVDIALEAGALLDQMQDLWLEATVDERHELLSGMLEAVYIDVPSRLLVGITPKGPFRQVFSVLEEGLLVPPEGALSGCVGGDGGELNPSSRGRPTRTSTSLAGVCISPAVPPPTELPTGQPIRSLAPRIGVGRTAPRLRGAGPCPSRRGLGPT